MKNLLNVLWKYNKILTTTMVGSVALSYIVFFLIIVCKINKNVVSEEAFCENIGLWIGIVVGVSVCACCVLHNKVFDFYRKKMNMMLPASMKEKYFSGLAIAGMADMLVLVFSWLLCFLPLAYYYKNIDGTYAFGGQIVDYTLSEYFKIKDVLLYIYLISFITIIGIVERNSGVVGAIVLGALYYVLITFVHQLPHIVVCMTYIVLVVGNFYFAYVLFKRRSINSTSIINF